MDAEMQKRLLERDNLKLATDQNPREYILATSKVKLAIGYSLIFVLIFGALTIAVVFGGSLIDWETNPVIALLIVIIAIILAIALGVFCGVKSSTRKWTIGLDGIKIYFDDKLKESFSIEGYTGSNTVRNYTNGIYTGTTHTISVTSSNGKSKKLEWPFAKERFSEAVECINELKYYGGFLAKGQEAIDSSNPGSDPTVNKIFEIDKKKLGGAVVRGVLVKLSPVFLVFAVLLVLTLIGRGDIPIELSLIFAVGAIGSLLWALVSGNKAKKKIPGRIEFRDDCVIVDGESYKKNQIKRIVATPANFSIGKKGCYWIRIRTINKDSLLCLGRSFKDKKNTYADYEELIGTLRSWALRRGLDYNTDLS